MKFAALLLIGIATAAAGPAAAQSNSHARGNFLPMPNTLPTMLFAPDPLAGTMLRTLIEPAPNSTVFAEVPPEPVVISVAASTQLVADPAPEPVPPAKKPKAAQTAQAAEPVVETPPDAAVEAPVESVPDAPGEAAVEPSPAVPAPDKAPPAANPHESTITVIVENVQVATGSVNVAICDKGLSREGCPYVHEIPAQQGFVQTEFDNIPPGNYAIVGYHDVNGNQQFDKTLGIPREPYALSNNAGEKLVPTFADAELPIKSGENAVVIRLRRLGG